METPQTTKRAALTADQWAERLRQGPPANTVKTVAGLNAILAQHGVYLCGCGCTHKLGDTHAPTAKVVLL